MFGLSPTTLHSTLEKEPEIVGKGTGKLIEMNTSIVFFRNILDAIL